VGLEGGRSSGESAGKIFKMDTRDELEDARVFTKRKTVKKQAEDTDGKEDMGF
jgi:hypothetical protein